MSRSRRELARRLEAVEDFETPRAALEQYATPAEIAASLLHVAALRGDLTDEVVVDLGAGTGVLAIGAALLEPARVVALEVDADALSTARGNETRVDPDAGVEWVLADVETAPLCVSGATVITNPPFGAQRGREGADRRFLSRAAEIGAVSYSVHNEGSRSFVESFAADRGGEVTHAFRAAFDLEPRFDFHEEERRRIDAELFRIEWP